MPSRPGTIRRMDGASVQRIAAGQAITDLASCVKELIDNALDAGSKKINSEYRPCWISIVAANPECVCE